MTQMFDKFIEERENPVMSATISQGILYCTQYNYCCINCLAYLFKVFLR